MRASSKRAVYAATFVVVAAAAWAATVVWRDDDCRLLSRLRGQPENSVTRHACSNTFLVRGAGDDFFVLLGEANHLPDEPVTFDSRARVFVGLHGERYDVTGQSLGPPSAGPMWRCPARLAGGRVRIVAPEGADRGVVSRICREAR